MSKASPARPTICSSVGGAGHMNHIARSCNRVVLKRQYISFVRCMLSTDIELHTVPMIACHTGKSPQRRWSTTVMTKSRIKNFRMRRPAAGMARFFSRSNRDRYRKLASGMISQAEQHQLLEDLAEEMDAFKREARCCLSPAAERSLVSDSRDRI
jgi:hypothetical protein